jgi:hypothetical protein
MSTMEPDEGSQDDAPRLDKLEAANAADAPRLDAAEAASDAPRLDRAPRLDTAGARSAEDDPDDSADS